MKALIFAAGRGERMRPLTEHTPKPLLAVGGKPLIVWHLEKLAAIGVREVVINTAHLAAQFPATLGDGSRWGLAIHYSHEGELPLETGGGMLHALPLLGAAPFLLLNGDIHCDVDFATLPTAPAGLAHLLLVSPPAYAAAGDFHLDADGRVQAEGTPRLTYAGIGVYRPELLRDWRSRIDASEVQDDPPRFPLPPLLRRAMREGQVSGQLHEGAWTDVGTPERLAELDRRLRAHAR
jgi:N-acetyl-alpha-D-muramate 1-phosphate uridylyltransferase